MRNKFHGGKRTCLLLLIVCIVGLLTGCTSKEIADKHGKILTYKLSELSNNVYVPNDNGTYSPLLVGAGDYMGFVDQEEYDAKGRFLWYANNTYDVDGLIPVLHKGQSLVMQYSETAKVPEKYSFEKYEDAGWTIGMHFFKNEENKLYINSSADTCPDSAAAKGMTSATALSGTNTLYEFNKETTMPLGSLNSDVNLLTGLEENGTYQFSIYVGTVYSSFTVPADTRLLVAKELKTYTFEECVTTTQDGYFNITIPDDFDSGYYYLNTIGLFYYDDSDVSGN